MGVKPAAVFLVAALCAVTASCAKPAPARVTALKLTGPSGARDLTVEDIRALPATEGWGGAKANSGRVLGPDSFRGVSLAALADLVGGLSEDAEVRVEAKDGVPFSMTFPACHSEPRLQPG